MKKNWKLSYTPLEYSQDIGMEFGIEKCAILVMKSGKRHLTDGVENQIKTRLERSEKKRILQILGYLGA